MNEIIILYGINDNNKDVTQICLDQITHNNIIYIPQGDVNRSNIFTDPLYGVDKKIFITINDKIFEYDQSFTVIINLIDYTINAINNSEINDKLNIIHNKLNIKYGTLNDELEEQKMALKYLTGNEKVLEIGSNIGRNSLVIASIVNNDTFLTLESDANIFEQLEVNKNLNNFTFHIENSALSKRQLIQKEWDTKPSDVLEEGFKWVNTISWNELKLKYPIDFDTLVLDCEGAFYYILMDMPEILDNIKLIIMENDYYDLSHKIYVDYVLRKYNFFVVCKQQGGWGHCYHNFYEVWKK
jgi:FkbM family methyltransferase